MPPVLRERRRENASNVSVNCTQTPVSSGFWTRELRLHRTAAFLYRLDDLKSAHVAQEARTEATISNSADCT